MPAILPDMTTTETLIVEATNRAREREKLKPVQHDKALALAARAFAQYLAKMDTFSHTADGRQPAARASAAGYSYCSIAENLAVSASSRGFEAKMLANATVEGWLKSPAHRANILAPYVTDVGVAVAQVATDEPKYVVVQMFGRPQALATAFEISNRTKKQIRYSLAGTMHTIDPGTIVRYRACEPKQISFLSAGSTPMSGDFNAENGRAYAITEKTDGVTVEVHMRDIER